MQAANLTKYANSFTVKIAKLYKFFLTGIKNIYASQREQKVLLRKFNGDFCPCFMGRKYRFSLPRKCEEIGAHAPKVASTAKKKPLWASFYMCRYWRYLLFPPPKPPPPKPPPRLPPREPPPKPPPPKLPRLPPPKLPPEGRPGRLGRGAEGRLPPEGRLLGRGAEGRLLGRGAEGREAPMGGTRPAVRGGLGGLPPPRGG